MTRTFSRSFRAPRVAALAAAAFASLFAVAGAAAQTPSPSPPQGPVVIDELRFDGPAGDRDLFIELRNNTANPINLNDSNPTTNPNGYFWFLFYTSPTGAGGASDPGWYWIAFPDDTIIPPHSRLLVDDTGYSLSAIAPADVLFDFQGTNIPSDGAVNLYTNGQTDGVNLEGLFVDGVAFAGHETYGGGDTLGEGTPLTPFAGTTAQYSWVRRSLAGQPFDTGDEDTGNNAADFRFVGVNGVGGSVFGVPAPQNAAAPTEGGTPVVSNLLDPAQPASAQPNRFYDSANTDLYIRRRLVNTAPAGSPPITELKLRVNEITTHNAPGSENTSQALLEVVNAPDQTINTIPVEGLEVDQSVPHTGGLNSGTVNVPLASVGGSLGPGEDIEVQFKLNVARPGSFRFYFNVESKPNP